MLIIHAVSIGPADSMGVYKAVRELSIGQADVGHEVHLVVHGQWPSDAIERAGVHVHQAKTLRSSNHIIRTLATGDAVVHTHSTWTLSTLLPLFKTHEQVRFVASPHGSLAPVAMTSRALKKAVAWALLFRPAMKRHHQIQVSSRKELFEVQAHRLKLPLRLVPNIVSPPAPGVLQGNKEFRVGFLGRIHPIKGVAELVQAWRSIEGEFPDWRLEVVGPLEDRPYSDLVRRELANTARATYQGTKYGADRWRFLHQSEVVAVPSASENFCYVVAEAYLAGTPVVATEGVPWPQINDQSIGWRSGMGSSSLADALRQAMMASSARRKSMGERGRKLVARDFERRSVACVSVEAYQELF